MNQWNSGGESRSIPDIVTKQQSDENARNNNIAQSEHGELSAEHSFDQKILRKNQFDRSFERFGDGHHHVGAKHPKDVVKEETAEQNASGQHAIQVQQFDAVDGESDAKNVVCDPVLWFTVSQQIVLE